MILDLKKENRTAQKSSFLPLLSSREPCRRIPVRFFIELDKANPNGDGKIPVLFEKSKRQSTDCSRMSWKISRSISSFYFHWKYE